MKRISIKSLMSYVALIAISLAALRNADETWEGIMLLLSMCLLCTSVIGMTQRKGRKRAWWCGFGVFGIGYLLAAFSENLVHHLPTTQLIVQIRRAVDIPNKTNYPIENARDQYIELSKEMAKLEKQPDQSAQIKAILVETQDNLILFDDPLVKGKKLSPSFQARIHLRQFLPGAENRDEFHRIGHYLSAILFGLIGATIAARMYEPPS